MCAFVCGVSCFVCGVCGVWCVWFVVCGVWCVVCVVFGMVCGVCALARGGTAPAGKLPGSCYNLLNIEVNMTILPKYDNFTKNKAAI